MNNKVIYMNRTIINYDNTNVHSEYIPGWCGIYNSNDDISNIVITMWEKPGSKTVTQYMITVEVHENRFFKQGSISTYWGSAFEVRQWVKDKYDIEMGFGKLDRSINDAIERMERHYLGEA